MTTTARYLGAIFAGGESRRFGTDKALAALDGRPLLAHAISALEAQVDDVIVVGRSLPGVLCVADEPAPNLGPLGGLNGALKYARDHGFTHVLTAGCDTFPIPSNLATLLNDGPTVIAGHWIFGCWPCALSDALDRHLRTSPDRSIRHWIAMSGARSSRAPQDFHNLNTPADLAAYALSLSSAVQP